MYASLRMLLVRVFPLLTALAFAAVCIGCGSPWTVVTASGPPSALKGKTTFVVTSDFAGMTVGKKTEAEYLAEKDEETRKNWEEDKVGVTEHFIKELGKGKGLTVSPASGGEGDDVVQVTVKWKFVEPGFYAAVVRAPTVMRARVSFSVGGTVVDEIEIGADQQADTFHPSTGQRMANCGEAIGGITAKFIAKLNKE